MTVEWFQARGISKQTLDKWPVGYGEKDGRQFVVFNYRRGEEIVNWKARWLDPKDHTQLPGGEARFWNLDRVLNAAPDTVFITEGEPDALALAETGIPEGAILAVPNGAPPSRASAGTRKYEFVINALQEGLNAKEYVILADNDAPGQNLLHDLVSFLGPACCSFVEWPEGIKDVNDALLAWGGAGLRQFLEDGTKQWPIVGVYTLDEIPEPPRS